MKRNLIFLFLVLTGLVFTSFIPAEREKGYIYWDERQLTWDDFKGRTPASTPYVALTHSAIKMAYGGEGKEVWFVIETVFDPKQSWKKKNVNDFILKHEQGHFDITEIHSRMLRKQISGARFKKYETITTEVEKMFQAIFKSCDKMQNLYDDETDHSKIKDEQLRWNDKIDSILQSLSAYAAPDLKLDVSYLLE